MSSTKESSISSTRATRPLQLVHSDVHGPVKVSTHHYWVSFIDDFSRFKAVYLLKRKSETFAAFKQFKAWAENVTGLRMGSLRDDKGGEYMSREFEAFCIDHGIQRQHTVRNRPQQNGVAERANRTIEEGVISMLYESGMPPSFWGKAISSFIHVSNRVTTTSLKGATPHEAFYGNKPDLSHLCVWGCTAYVSMHIIDAQEAFYRREQSMVILVSSTGLRHLYVCYFHIIIATFDHWVY